MFGPKILCHKTSLFDARCHLGQPRGFKWEQFTFVIVTRTHRLQLRHSVRYRRQTGRCPPPVPYLQVLILLHKEGFPIVPQLHVQVHRLAIDLNIHLHGNRTC